MDIYIYIYIYTFIYTDIYIYMYTCTYIYPEEMAARAGLGTKYSAASITSGRSIAF
jgi:hypothetical protein